MSDAAPLIYLDNAATSFPKAPGVGEAMKNAIERGLGNPGRSGHRAAEAADRIVEDVRFRMGRLVGVTDPKRLILTSGATEGLNIALQGAVRAATLDAGIGANANRAPMQVIATALEHNAALRPLEMLRRAGAIELDIVGCDADGFIDAGALGDALRSDTAIVMMTHASNVLGTIQPLEELIGIVRGAAPECLVVVDAAQTAGLMAIDAPRLDIDLLAFSGHKSVLGPPGTGGLYVSKRAFPGDGAPARVWPLTLGGTGGDSEATLHPATLPRWLECGTKNVAGAAGLQPALQISRGRMLEHERSLAQRFTERVAEARGVRVLGTGDFQKRTGVVSLVIEGIDSQEAAAILDESFGIAARGGLHCSPHAHAALGTLPGGALRISPGPQTTEDEMDRAAQAIHEIAGSL